MKLFLSVHELIYLAWNFREGEQIYENYGQPNHIYFQYHGFTLTEEDFGNSYDCVHFEFNITKEEGAAIDWKEAKEIAAVS